jgi:lipopolysaccharide export system protein LptA
MKRSQAAWYARASAAVAVVLATITTAVYLQHAWKAQAEKKKAPPPAPSGVERLSSGLTFSKVDGNRTIFTVDASKSTDFKDKGASLLEDVKITIFGKIGERHDIIHTQSCQYGQESGFIVCSGDVKIDLQTAADAERVANDPQGAPAQIVQVETRGVTFDRGSGKAKTAEPVAFSFPNGSGTAVGAEYKSEEGLLRLLHDVQMNLSQVPEKDEKKKGKPLLAREVHVGGANLTFSRDNRKLHLAGPAQAESSSARLTAGELTLDLDKEFHAMKLSAASSADQNRPQLTSHGSGGDMAITGDVLTADFAPAGWITKVDASGNAGGSRQGPQENDEFSAKSGTLELWPRVGQPKELNLRGDVTLSAVAARNGEKRKLQTASLKMDFSGGKEGEPSKPKRAETLSEGTIEWTDPASQGGPASETKVRADRLAMDFGPQGKARQLQAFGNVHAERGLEGRPPQTATAKSGVAQMLSTGGWSQMDLQGDVKLKEADHSGQADHATFVRAAQTAVLTGRAVARDATTETRAARIIFAQDTGDIRAEGGVRSTDFSAKASAVQLAPAPANISSDTLQANSKTGRALYTGYARLWQGDSVLQADSIELLRETRVLHANGNVRAVFPEVTAPVATPAPQPSLTAQAPAPAAAKKTTLWHVTAGALTYWDMESRAHLEKNVVVESVEQTMHGAALELYFTRGVQSAVTASNDSHATTPNSPANTVGGAQQISRAVGTGGVIVEEGQRKATAEQGVYTAADGKFVMSGGTPTLYDASQGTTVGRQLTFFLAGDTIIVDSENGSRTVTKHRVEK